MLTRLVSRAFKESRHIQICEAGGPDKPSGIRATLFGGTGVVGAEIGEALGSIGSDMIYPSKERYTIYDNVKQLRMTCSTGSFYIAHNTNFEDPRAIRRTLQHSNLVVNCIGPRKKFRQLEQFEQANVTVPREIARQARLAGVKRLVHFSNVGADPKSTSMDLATKFHGERAVLDEFPEATILRLGTVVSMQDYFQRIFRLQMAYFQNFVPVYSDLTALRQPIAASDISLCLLNAIKMPESMGRTYEVVGPHVYTLKELYELMMNILKRPLVFAKINRQLALGAARVFSGQFFSYDEIIKTEIDMIATRASGLGSTDDLFVKPCSVVPVLEEHLALYAARYGESKDLNNV